jgi:hypothetical protein
MIPVVVEERNCRFTIRDARPAAHPGRRAGGASATNPFRVAWGDPGVRSWGGNHPWLAGLFDLLPVANARALVTLRKVFRPKDLNEAP